MMNVTNSLRQLKKYAEIAQDQLLLQSAPLPGLGWKTPRLNDRIYSTWEVWKWTEFRQDSGGAIGYNPQWKPVENDDMIEKNVSKMASRPLYKRVKEPRLFRHPKKTEKEGEEIMDMGTVLFGGIFVAFALYAFAMMMGVGEYLKARSFACAVADVDSMTELQVQKRVKLIMAQENLDRGK